MSRTIEDIPHEILATIIYEATKTRSPNYAPVLKTPDDLDAIERNIDSLLACRVVNKKFGGIATNFCGQFIAILPKLRDLTEGTRINNTNMHSSTVGYSVSDLMDFILVKRLRQAIPYAIDKLFTKPEDQAKAKTIFAGFTYHAANPEMVIVSRHPKDAQKLVFLEVSTIMGQVSRLVGGALTFDEPLDDIAGILKKKRQIIAKRLANPAKFYLGVMKRSGPGKKTSFKLNRKALNMVAEEVGCAEWSLAEDEKQFLFPRFILAVSGYPNLAMDFQAVNFSMFSSELIKPVIASLRPNKIPLKENEVPPIIPHKKAQYPIAEIIQNVKQTLLDLKPTFHSYEEVERFYTFFRGYVNAWLIGNLRMCMLGQSYIIHDPKAKDMKKYMDDTVPMIEFIKTETTFVPTFEGSIESFDIGLVATHTFKLTFSDSLQLKITVQLITSEQQLVIVNVYLSGIGLKPMTDAMKEKNSERLLIAYSKPYRPSYNVLYPDLIFRYQEVVDMIDGALNQLVGAKNFSLEWLIRKLIFEVSDVRMQDEMSSPYSLETFFMRSCLNIKRPDGDSGSESGSGSGSEVDIFDSDSDGDPVEGDDGSDSDDSYASDEEKSNDF